MSDGSPVPDVGLRGTPPVAQRTSVRTHSPTPQATSRSPATMHSHTLPPVTFASALPSPAQRRTRLVRPQPTRAPPITPHTTATGYWRVHGFARDGTETLAFHPHTHTHITKPRAQHARACNMAHRLPWRTPLSSIEDTRRSRLATRCPSLQRRAHRSGSTPQPQPPTRSLAAVTLNQRSATARASAR